MNSLFYRTYWKDFAFLKVSLESVEKHAKGWDDILVTIAFSSKDRADYGSLMDRFPKVRFEFVREQCENDYLGQQFTKINADHWVKEGAVAFIDSDCVLHERFTPRDMIRPDGRILWLYTPYADIPAGAVPWQKPTEHYLGRKVEHEFMRRHPMMIRTSTMKLTRDLCKERHGIELWKYLRRTETKQFNGGVFSEFNVMGACAYYDEIEHGLYDWVKAGNEVERPFMRQFYSWDGIEKAKPEIEKMGYSV